MTTRTSILEYEVVESGEIGWGGLGTRVPLATGENRRDLREEDHEREQRADYSRVVSEELPEIAFQHVCT